MSGTVKKLADVADHPENLVRNPRRPDDRICTIAAKLGSPRDAREVTEAIAANTIAV